MKTLYVLRHADAVKEKPDGDMARPINEKGKEESIALAEALKDEDFSCDAVLCSIALRAKQTWQQIASKNDYLFETYYMNNLYNPTVENVIDVLENIDNEHNSALIISHNPTVSDVANHLTGDTEESFFTANMKCFHLNIDSWSELKKGCGEIKWSLPK